MNAIYTILPDNCNECRLYLKDYEYDVTYCALNPTMDIWGNLIERPKLCPLNQETIDLRRPNK